MIELLAPAGNREKLELAIAYGADAVYLAGNDFSLRNQSGNFSLPELYEAVAYAHANGVKVYLTVNIYARNYELGALADFLKEVAQIKPDALILADAGVLALARKYTPHIALHLSTQANTTNSAALSFWQAQGVSRVNVARELTLAEIAEISASTPGLEIEAFVHGAMCISHSGRCLMSSFMAGRDANRGMCTHPCRWQYHLMEETRPGQYHPVLEDERGTYFFNSRDLCMLPHLDKLLKSGVGSIKIEGRMKTVHYLATVLRVYREALDAYLANPNDFTVKQTWLSELETVNTRGYTTGFYLAEEQNTALLPDYDNTHNYAEGWVFTAKVLADNPASNLLVNTRNQMFVGDSLAIISPRDPQVRSYTIAGIRSEEGVAQDVTNPNQRVWLQLAGNAAEIKALSLIRKKID